MAAAGFSLNKLPLIGKIGIGVFAAGLLAVAYFFVLHNEISARIDQAKRHTSELDAELARERQAQASYFADRDELAMRQQRQRELNKVLPADTEAAAFLSSLQQVSNISGIDLKAWQPLEEQTKEFYAKVPMRLEITGKFHQLVKFVYEVGKLDRIINMENIELFNPKIEGDDVVLSARCLATTFHLLKKPQAAAPPGAPPGTPAPGGQQ
jgi:type IV pilus assembly protein PilO